MPPAVASVYNGRSVNKGSKPIAEKSSSESSVAFTALERKAEMGLTTCGEQRVTVSDGHDAIAAAAVSPTRRDAVRIGPKNEPRHREMDTIHGDGARRRGRRTGSK